MSSDFEPLSHINTYRFLNLVHIGKVAAYRGPGYYITIYTIDILVYFIIVT